MRKTFAYNVESLADLRYNMGVCYQRLLSAYHRPPDPFTTGELLSTCINISFSGSPIIIIVIAASAGTLMSEQGIMT